MASAGGEEEEGGEKAEEAGVGAGAEGNEGKDSTTQMSPRRSMSIKTQVPCPTTR
jgi:hypothetical protein